MAETKIERVTCPQIGEAYTHIKHKSGLSIYVSEMNGFSTTEALFGTKYGSINTQFKTKQETDFCCVPEGIAHYLEHKLFENEDCDVFDLYAKTGANANAFTSFDKTCYLFSCSDHYKESLEILLSFVQSPYFTTESVQKEQGIIGQEIKMCNDDPSWRIFFNMLQGLYHKHPVKIDIAGTIESIAQITPELLYRCYHTFYNLHNMVLSVAGNCKVEEVIEVADRLLKPCENMELECVFPEEPAEIVRTETVEAAPIGTTMFVLGYKCNPSTSLQNLKKELLATLVLQTLTHTASPLYQTLLKKNLINDTFSTEVFDGDDFFVAIFEGESSDPYAVRAHIFDAVAEAAKNGLDETLFESCRKSAYGKLISKFNHVESVANLLINAAMSHVTPFDMVTQLSALTIADANHWLQEELLSERATISIMKNKD
jgi:predicted Zn-dependent peptidase